MATIRKFEDLEICQTARNLSLKVYQLTESGPRIERLSLQRSNPGFSRFRHG